MKNKIVSSLYTGKSLTLVVSSAQGIQTKICEASHANFKSIVQAFRKKDWDLAISLMDVQQAINVKSVGRFTVKDGQVWFRNEPVHGVIFDRILSYMRENLDFQPLLKFADLLWDNPSRRARENFFKFLEHKNLPITESGMVICYKGVSNTFYSITAGTLKLIQGKADASGHIYNAPGETIECDPSVVCDDPNVGCASSSLHVGSYSYAKDFAGSNGKLLVCEINPKDVRAVPTDCNFQKVRVCKYRVLAEDGRQLDEIKDTNYGKPNKSGPKRDKNGRFAKKR